MSPKFQNLTRMMSTKIAKRCKIKFYKKKSLKWMADS